MLMRDWKLQDITLFAAGLSGLLALLIGFVIPQRATMTAWFDATAYYFIFATFLLWLHSLWPRNSAGFRFQNLLRRH